MDKYFYITRAKQILENCPTYSIDEALAYMYSGAEKPNYDEAKRRDAIIKTMLLVKEFHGTDSPLYRLLDDNFHSVEKCPVENVIALFLDHLDTFYPDSEK
ncbi:MAG: hypothetical protein ACTTJM_03230 [Bergeyella cardium]|nr:MAG TPA: hypothetical protein [Caudoviricetes sp.]